MRCASEGKVMFRLWNSWLVLSYRLLRAEGESIAGITNRTEDGYFVVMLDYDGMEEEWVRRDLCSLQEIFRLSDFHLFRTSRHGYHAVCFDKMNFCELQDLMQNACIDIRHIHVPMRHGLKLVSLRLTRKRKAAIRYIGRLPSQHHVMQKSRGHMEFYSKAFPGMEIRRYNADTEDRIVFCTYPI